MSPESTVSRAEQILAGLDSEQAAVARAVSGPVRVLAGAGTGKTRAITHRIAHSVVIGESDPERTLAVTFTNRAAGEMRHRLRTLGAERVQVRTFHAAALRQLRYFWPQLSPSVFPELIASKAPVVARSLSFCKVDSDTALVRDISGDIEWCKSNMIDSALVHKAKREFAIDTATFAKVFDAYESMKKERNQLDFEDILTLMSATIRSRPEIEAAVHKAYRWFTVDEYQDVNPLQKNLLDLWLGDRDDLCVVGDPSQTIYSFTGASAQYLAQFATQFPRATRIELVRCYRCTPEITSMANAVMSGGNNSVTLRSQREPGPPPKVTAYADDNDEAAGVAQSIRELLDSGTSAADIAVLYRINAQSAEYETAFADAHIPCVLRGTERYFDRPEVKTATMLLRGDAKNPDTAGESLVDRIEAVLSSMGWSPEPPRGTGAVREKWESLLALTTMAQECSDSMSLSEFVHELDQRASVEHAPGAAAVTLASIHSAKGLEWPIVFLIGCSEGLLPLSYADTSDSIEEERRLTYVAVSRAGQQLHISWAKTRTPGGKATRTLSRFIADLPPGVFDGTLAGIPRGSSTGSFVAGESRRDSRRQRKGPRPCRVCGKALVTAGERTLGHCHGCPVELHEELFEALRDWRKELSAAKAVPAYIVFTDATLTAIAEQVPNDLESLAEIPGVGPAKLSEFGGEVLEIVRRLRG
jgi:DNA helicase II / ATP-dependent DNA helicase PcrA